MGEKYYLWKDENNVWCLTLDNGNTSWIQSRYINEARIKKTMQELFDYIDSCRLLAIDEKKEISRLKELEKSMHCLTAKINDYQKKNKSA